MPPDLMSLALLVGLVGGAFWIAVFAVVTVAARTCQDDMEAIISSRDKDLLEHQAKSHTKTNAA
jgi:hypothetical protein